MNELEHYEDNLNSNLSNKLALTRFVEVAKKVRANLNDKYDIGFIDPRTNSSMAQPFSRSSRLFGSSLCSSRPSVSFTLDFVQDCHLQIL